MTLTSGYQDVFASLSSAREEIEAEAEAKIGELEREIRQFERERDKELSRLGRASAILGKEKDAPSPRGAKAVAKPVRRKPSRALPTQAAARERREAIIRYLIEEGESRSPRQIRQALGIPKRALEGALKRLVEEGQIVRIGVGGGTRYAAKLARGAVAKGGPVPGSRANGTPHGLLLATIKDRNSASVRELAQVTRLPEARVRQECFDLVAEEELETMLRDGQTFFYISGSREEALR